MKHCQRISVPRAQETDPQIEALLEMIANQIIQLLVSIAMLQAIKAEPAES